MQCPLWPDADQKRQLRLHLHFYDNLFEKSHLHTSKTPMPWKKGTEILGLTLQRHNKFLKERENEQLPQVQSIGPDGMDGHHHWSTTDKLVSP